MNEGDAAPSVGSGSDGGAVRNVVRHSSLRQAAALHRGTPFP